MGGGAWRRADLPLVRGPLAGRPAAPLPDRYWLACPLGCNGALVTHPTSVLPGETGGPDGLPGDIGQDGAVAGTSPDQEVPATEHAPCGCPAGPGRAVSDVQAHADWHALVVEQGGPAGEVSTTTLQAARRATRGES